MVQWQQHQPPLRRRSRRFGRQRGQRHDAAFAPVVGPENQQHVFERDDHHQAPEDDRDSADEVRRIQWNPGCRAEDFLHGVQRAGADVAVNHAQGAQCERRGAFPV